ncbi:uncharacterized protein LOC120081543 isoform X3 [Benincasa hispida]|uniref:uncharacterized protein LOC120081543 isoform X3 n=1 Tax=Benincasa hispida TaxID=102211 RepID=UPI0019010271|nr:uncharacterized protein LOC120081543 isoform X3 [Benincasa hispida]
MEVSKKVLITGVSKGLGRALALELATHNHTIIGCSRSQLKLDSLQDELSRLYPNNHHLLFNVDVVNLHRIATLKSSHSLLKTILSRTLLIVTHIEQSLILKASILKTKEAGKKGEKALRSRFSYSWILQNHKSP